MARTPRAWRWTVASRAGLAAIALAALAMPSLAQKADPREQQAERLGASLLGPPHGSEDDELAAVTTTVGRPMDADWVVALSTRGIDANQAVIASSDQEDGKAVLFVAREESGRLVPIAKTAPFFWIRELSGAYQGTPFLKVRGEDRFDVEFAYTGQWGCVTDDRVFHVVLRDGLWRIAGLDDEEGSCVPGEDGLLQTDTRSVNFLTGSTDLRIKRDGDLVSHVRGHQAFPMFKLEDFDPYDGRFTDWANQKPPEPASGPEHATP